MASRTKKKSKQKKGRDKTADILRRVDRLPIIDARTADEIVGYDRNGLPQSDDAKPVSEVIFRRPKRATKPVSDFLKYRRRDWEQ